MQKHFQIKPRGDPWNSARAEGQRTLTIISDVPMELYSLPPANGVTVKQPANGSPGVSRCTCLCACLRADCQLNGCVKALLLLMSNNEYFKHMLAPTYHKRSANMSKLSSEHNLTTLCNSKPSKIQRRTRGYLQQRTGPELSVAGRKKKRKETLHKHRLTWECASSTVHYSTCESTVCFKFASHLYGRAKISNA